MSPNEPPVNLLIWSSNVPFLSKNSVDAGLSDFPCTKVLTSVLFLPLPSNILPMVSFKSPFLVSLASGCLSLSPLTLKNLLNLLSEFLVLSSSVPEFPAGASLASSTSLCLKNLFFGMLNVDK